MALFTDGPVSSIEDLAAQDSQLLSVASAEGIDVTAKLALAHESLGMDIEELLKDGSAGLGLSNVVTTPAVRQWHTYRALEAIYGDAYHNQLNDRYAGKRDQFRELGRQALDRLRLAGLGVVWQPVPRATPPDLRAVAGWLPDGTYYATMAWVNAAAEEGAAANVGAITVSSGGFEALPAKAPHGVCGWNLYAGSAPENLTRQNDTPIMVAASWNQTEAPRAGGCPSGGQAPTCFLPIPRILRRG